MLTPGTKLGVYEIVAPLGAGGMGEVYRARDTRLQRNAAIKVLAGAFAADRDLLSRFEREARSASALNHPNIVTIYELGEAGGTCYIAMELVEGTTLRKLIAAGSMSARRAIEIAVQVSEGLAKAHDAGIAHRDLKPENVMVSADGFVKILDFGLAKLVRPDDGAADETGLSLFDTRPGMVLGTLQYMSPEQASGGDVDFRSDQFSFGAMLYEMVTGRPAFQRGTRAATLVAVLQEHAAPVAALNADAPAPLCWAIERCLAKQADSRYVSTRELARELAAIRDRFAERPAKQPESSRPANLPVPRTAFVGRETEIVAVTEMLQRPDVRLVTITGPGGIGKTRLAVEAASALVGRFSSVHYVPLAPLNDAALVASAIVQTLEIRDAGAQSPLDALKKHLQDVPGDLLIVLDNFEHVMQAAPVVAELLVAAPGLTLLITSRAALHVYGEHEYPVPALSVPHPRSVPPIDALSRYSAIALFVQRAVAAKPGFELNAQNASAITEICTRLDGLPLAIELAAARTKVLSPSAMRARLASRLQFLTGGARDLPERQQTLRAAIDWSYDLLSPAEQKLLQRLSVFVGGCTLEGAEAVCDTRGDLGVDLLEGMTSMVDKSLLQQTEQPNGESRFLMLETILEYAREKLTAGGEDAFTRRTHAAYCLVLAEEEETANEAGATSAEWLERIALEHDNFRAALDWLTETGNAEWGLRLGTALFRFWETREFFAEGRDRLDRLLQLPGAAAPTKARARALFAAGALDLGRGHYDLFDAENRENLEIMRQLGDRQGMAVALNALAASSMRRGDMAEAQALFEESLAILRECGDPRAIAGSLNNVANVVKTQGDYDRAHALYAEGLAIFRGLRDQVGIAWLLNQQGEVARRRQDFAAARSLYDQSLASFRDVGDGLGAAGTLADLGNLARDRQDLPRAHALYRESLEIFQTLEHKRGIARVLECLACAAAEHEAEQALRLAGAAAALRESMGVPLSAAEQAELDVELQGARQALPNGAGAAAWLEGWTLPVEQTVAELLAQEATAPPTVTSIRLSTPPPRISTPPWPGR